MEVKIISERTIKPSSPTPLHLKTHKMSYLDQFMAPAYVPMILFYPGKGGVSVEERSELLTRSLSEALSRFYPLARRVIDNLSVDCNDEGIGYFRTRVNRDMLEFLGQPDLTLLQKLLAREVDPRKTKAGDNVAFVQENVFECGGVAVGVCINHLVVDGTGMISFLKCWGAIARVGRDPGQIPDFVAAPLLFPQNGAFPRELSFGGVLSPFAEFVEVDTGRFAFDSSSLAALKLKAASPLVPNPSRVEVVSALIWKCAALAFRANSETKRPTLLTLSADLRGRTEPPLPACTMGNFLIVLHAKIQGEIDAETDFSQLVHAIREAKGSIRTEFLKTRQEDGKGYNGFCDAIKEVSEALSGASSGGTGAYMLTFTSWLTFGMYEVDFGWGKPAWFSTAALGNGAAQQHTNRVILNETRKGDGIEAWVNLGKQNMAIFECNEELAAYSSLNPSPLGLSDA